MHRSLVIVFITAIVCSACSATPAVSLTPSPTSTATHTPTATVTQTPSATFTPSITPTLSMPLAVKTAIPSGMASIDPSNAAALREIAGYTVNPLTALKAGGPYAYYVTTEDVEVYDNTTGALLAVIPEGLSLDPHTLQLFYDGFQTSSQGRFIMVTTSGVKVYDHTGKLLYSHPVDPSMQIDSSGVAISSDGNLAVISLELSTGEQPSKTTFELVDVSDQSILYSWDGYGRTMHGTNPTFYENDSILATEFDNSIWMWNVGDQSLLQQFIPRDACWAISPDGSKYTYAVGSSLAVFETSSRKLIRSITLSNDLVKNCPSFTDNSVNIRLYNYSDQQYYLFNAVTGEPAGNMPYVSPIRIQMSSHFDLDANTALKYSQTFQIPSPLVDENNTPLHFPFLIGPSSKQDLVIKSGTNKAVLLSAKWSGMMLESALYARTHRFIFYTIWDTPNKPQGVYGYSGKTDRAEVGWSNYWIDRAVLSGDEKLAALMLTNTAERYYSNGKLIIYDLNDRSVIWEKAQDMAVLGGFSQDDSALVLLGNKSVSLMQTSSPFKVEDHPLAGLGDAWIEAAALTPDKKILAVAFRTVPSATVRLYDLQSNTILVEFQPFQNDRIKFLNFSEQGQLLQAVSLHGWYKLWGLYP